MYSWYGKIHDMPAFKVECVDATGAGDAFSAGLITYINGLEGMTLKDRLDGNNNSLNAMIMYAAACGAAAVTEKGCHDGVSEMKVSNLISEQGDQISAGIKIHLDG